MLSYTCRGRITYYTEPPETYTRSSHVSAEIVKEMSAAFDINSLMSSEQKALQGISYELIVKVSEFWDSVCAEFAVVRRINKAGQKW